MICAKTSDVPSIVNVGLCALPRISGWTTGPLWIVEYNEAKGYALVSGG